MVNAPTLDRGTSHYRRTSVQPETLGNQTIDHRTVESSFPDLMT